ncbi:PemB family protein [Cellvibrio polysaccharolyticus]|uniref:Uncharacterized protein n=1 Tax=Cellvibrio polysaccharolyticus TaxID=2082724 RepID=A0A928V6V4_9GAMM|nr:hypothetical protein [Cellvibrio polysaccharolyticus]MBE8718235.1 hypothetical protein [Cellvibrio polysaccharolyticus]
MHTSTRLARFSMVILIALLAACEKPAVSSLAINTLTGESLQLNSRHFYVNPALPASKPHTFQFKNLHDAVAAADSGSEQQPMVIYLEPDVYPMNGTETDRGLYIHQDWLSLIGLASDPQDVVLADNRGHTIGASSEKGSSPAETLFVTGTGFRAENLTLGNYCNVDLVYPKDPSKNQPKRSATITQAYVIGAHHPDKVLDKYVFKNVRFVSMLDTIALGHVKRAYYENVYVQGTDDYMGGGDIHVMKNAVLHNYTSKPVYSAGKNGMAFIDSEWRVAFSDPQDLTITKVSSPIYLINNNFSDTNGNLRDIRWANYPRSDVQSMSWRTTREGEPYTIQPQANTLLLSDRQAAAFSVHNLLKGEDDWDPAGDKATDPATTDAAINVSVTANATLRTGEAPVILQASVFPADASQTIHWHADNDMLTLEPIDSQSVRVIGHNDSEASATVQVTASAENGIYNHSVVTVHPALLPAPAFISKPALSGVNAGSLQLSYALDLAHGKHTRPDHSHVTWYRARDKDGSNALPVAISHGNQPLLQYALTTGDVGHYLLATVAPAHNRSQPGEPQLVISARAITLNDIPGDGLAKFNISTDFKHLPTGWQPQLLDGTWTQDTFYPKDQKVAWRAEETTPWTYDRGINGAGQQTGLLTTAQGARLLYSQSVSIDDMRVVVEMNPAKMASQGFGSPNGQYLEIYIKYDTRSQSGYALRIERTNKYGFATDYTLYRYENGVGKAISDSISTTAFSPGARVELTISKGVFTAKATTSSARSSDQIAAGLPDSVTLLAQVENNTFGGAGLQHTGTVGGESRLQITRLSINYDINEDH